MRLRKRPTLMIAVATVGALFGGMLGVATGSVASASVTSGITVVDGLNLPTGVFVDSAGNVYVANAASGDVVEVTKTGPSGGSIVAGGNGEGSAANQLDFPGGVSVDSASDVYVVDAFNSRVQKWTPGATSGVTVAGGNGSGAAANQLSIAVGIFVDSAGDVYIADTLNNRVQEWAPGATSGVTVAGGNGAGAAANQLNEPNGVYVDNAGNVYVADTDNNRVQEWAPGATSGVTVAGGNGSGSADNQFSNPLDVFVDGAGDVYVADAGNDRVQEWAPGATSGVTVAGGNGAGSADNQLANPGSVYVDGSGDVYVTDQANNRVQEWEPGPNGAPLTSVDPQSQTVFAGADVTFTAGAIGKPLPSVQWEQSVDGGRTWSDIAGATSADYSITNVPLLDFGFEFRAVFTNSAGSDTTDPATLLVNSPAPTVTLQPNSQAVFEGQSVIFTAAANGNPAPTVQWQQSSDGGTTWTDISGATSGTYSITDVPLSDNGFEFEAVFTNSAGTATTNPATLTVNPAVAPTVTTQPTSQSVPFGTGVTFSAAANGEPSPSVQWQLSTNGGTTWTDISGATSDTYTIFAVPASDNGNQFRAVFTNSAGTATTNPATLSVTAPPPTTSMLLPATGATVSGDTWVDARASAQAGLASVRFEVSGGSVSDQVVSASTDTTFGWLGAWDTTDVANGTYTVQSVATDSLGQSTTSAPVSVTVDNQPLATTVLVPTNGATLSGSSTALDAIASGTSDITGVQFVINGVSSSYEASGPAVATIYGWIASWSLSGVPAGSYTIESVATESGGGTATSAPITVTVS